MLKKNNFEWEKLLLKQIKPPHIPKTEKIDFDNCVCNGSRKTFENIIASEETAELPLPSTKPPHGWDEQF